MTQDNSKDSPQNAHSDLAQSITTGAISKLEPGLYITATPIGNLRDITLRALDALNSADLILCEDTRVSQKLLSAFAIKTPLQAYHDHNAAKVRPHIMQKLSEGQVICLISDAGTPLVSDPGFRLLEACIEENVPVTSLPGASSPITALTLAGLPSDAFAFMGFFPSKNKSREEILSKVKDFPGTVMFFESARRLLATLTYLEGFYKEREAVVARELTKKFEEIKRGSLKELAAFYAEEGAPKGEIVLLIGPGQVEEVTEESIEAALAEALESMSTKDAASFVAQQLNVPRKKVYNRALALGKKRAT